MEFLLSQRETREDNCREKLWRPRQTSGRLVMCVPVEAGPRSRKQSALNSSNVHEHCAVIIVIIIAIMVIVIIIAHLNPKLPSSFLGQEKAREAKRRGSNLREWISAGRARGWAVGASGREAKRRKGNEQEKERARRPPSADDKQTSSHECCQLMNVLLEGAPTLQVAGCEIVFPLHLGAMCAQHNIQP